MRIDGETDAIALEAANKIEEIKRLNASSAAFRERERLAVTSIAQPRHCLQ